AAGPAAASGSGGQPANGAGSPAPPPVDETIAGPECVAPAPDLRAFGCTDDNTVELSATAAPALADDQVPIATALALTYPEGSASEPVTLVFRVSGSFDPTRLAVVRAEPRQSTGSVAEVEIEVHGQEVRVVVAVGGTYTLVESPKPPRGCSDKLVRANVNAQTDADIAPLQGATRVVGNLTIRGTVSELAALQCLTFLDGALEVNAAGMLAKIDLPGLARVQGRIHLVNARSLTELLLPRLRSVGLATDGVSVHLEQLTELHTVDAHSLVDAAGDLVFDRLGGTADAPLTLSLDALTYLPGDLTLAGLKTLQSLQGFAQLSTVAALDLNNTEQLTRLTGFAKLQRVRGRLSLAANKGLYAAAFDGLREVGGGIVLKDHMFVTTLDLHTLTLLGASDGVSLSLQNAPKLGLLDARALEYTPGSVLVGRVGDTAEAALALQLDALSDVQGDLSLTQLRRLDHVDGLGALSHVGGQLAIGNTEQLAAVSGLAKLASIDGALTIEANRALDRVELPALETLGSASFKDDAVLRVIALPKVNAATGPVSLSGLTKLTELQLPAASALPGGLTLTRVGDTAGSPLQLDLAALTSTGGLTLTALKTLPNVDPFAKLTRVDGNLAVTSNPALTSLSGFDALDTLGGNLQITGNQALSTCAAESIGERLKPEGSSGTRQISGNQPDDSCVEEETPP
ncbi:MAG: hypothetical protein ABW321_17205, partial [Polyangiales bacterium]